MRGITVKGLAGSTAYLYLDAIEVGKGADRPKARVELEVQTAQGDQAAGQAPRARARTCTTSPAASRRTRASFVTRRRRQPRHHRAEQRRRHRRRRSSPQDVTEEPKRRIQIREVIRAHLDKERELFAQGIKVLSLFFIDEVAKYRDYDREDTLGDYARVFEEEYERVLADDLGQLDLDDAAERYRKHVEAIPVAIDAPGLLLDRQEDRAARSTATSHKTRRRAGPVERRRRLRPDPQGQGAAAVLRGAGAVHLLALGAARGLGQPQRLRHGHAQEERQHHLTRRQEIGRGLRLSVDQHGERMDNPVTVHDINELTVVTDESYTDFVTGAAEGDRRVAGGPPAQGERRVLHRQDDHARRRLDERAREGARAGALQLPASRTTTSTTTTPSPRRTRTPAPTARSPRRPRRCSSRSSTSSGRSSTRSTSTCPMPADGRKPKKIPLNEANFKKKEFQELWGRINHKAVYQVEFDSAELIAQVRRRARHVTSTSPPCSTSSRPASRS